MRQFYGRHGFLHPDIDYPASQLDTTDNQIHVVFKLDEGPPVIIQDVSFVGPNDSYAFYQFPEADQSEWVGFREEISVRTGDRYTTFDRIRIQDEALLWLKNRGYAFANVSSSVQIDSTANTADLTFGIDTGPVAYVDSILVEGNESVSRQVVVRELPLDEGDRFKFNRLVRGQRELFGLNLFRLALVEVPEQPRDSSVTVQVRLREGFPRYVNAQTGYGRESGATAEALWSHRNFFGGARDFNVNLVANSGYFATITPHQLPSRLFRGSLSLRQPYLVVNRLSGVVQPFIQYESDPLLRTNTRFGTKAPLDINVREIGLTTTLIYDLLPFRTLSLEHEFSRTRFFESILGTEGEIRDRFNKSIFRLNAVLGKTNDYVRPSRGFLIRPFVEAGGRLLASDINYAKYGTEFTHYYPLSEQSSFDVRLFAGKMQLFGTSRYDERNLFNAAGRIKEAGRGAIAMTQATTLVIDGVEISIQRDRMWDEATYQAAMYGSFPG